MPRILELQETEFTDDQIDHCFYVENLNTQNMKRVRMSNIFNWIKETAIKEGLTVKMDGEQIMFIKGYNYINFKTKCAFCSTINKVPIYEGSNSAKTECKKCGAVIIIN